MTRHPELIALGVIYREDFGTFLRWAYEALYGTPPQDNWHIDALAQAATQVVLGRERRLLVNLPPRSLKSFVYSIALPAWLLIRNPKARIICVSYSQPLAVEFQNEFRRLLALAAFQLRFPHVRVSPAKNSETEVKTSRGGGRLATSVGGTLTGRGGDIIIVDDPLNASDAYSEAERDRVNNWFLRTVLSRLDDPRTGAILVVGQRLHEDDIFGRLLKAGGGWRHLSLPAIGQVRARIPLGRGRTKIFKEEELLHPKRLPASELQALRNTLGSAAFSAQYLQDPVPASGNIIKRPWLMVIDRAPEVHSRDITVISLDSAYKTGAANDYSVFLVARVREQIVTVIRVIRERLEFPDLQHLAFQLAREFTPQAFLIEDQGSGQSLIQAFRNEGLRVTPVKPEGDKVSRTHGVSAMIEGGGLHILNNQPWTDDYVNELVGFPNGKHDDQVDATTQLLHWVQSNPYKPIPLVSPPVIPRQDPWYWNLE